MKATITMSVEFDKDLSVSEVRDLAEQLEGMQGHTPRDDLVIVKKVTVRSIDIPREENRKRK